MAVVHQTHNALGAMAFVVIFVLIHTLMGVLAYKHPYKGDQQ